MGINFTLDCLKIGDFLEARIKANAFSQYVIWFILSVSCFLIFFVCVKVQKIFKLKYGLDKIMLETGEKRFGGCKRFFYI